jgi:putative sterol carrier protein
LTDSDEMAGVLETFVEQFNHSAELPRMTAGWDRTILIRAQDAAWAHGLRVEEGAIRALPAAALPAEAEIVLEGSADTLASIFRGELSPTEPYLDGTLLVRSSESDMMKLDVFTLMVWGE